MRRSFGHAMDKRGSHSVILVSEKGIRRPGITIVYY